MKFLGYCIFFQVANTLEQAEYRNMSSQGGRLHPTLSALSYVCIMVSLVSLLKVSNVQGDVIKMMIKKYKLR